jgi:outer membrane protein assembly factor BamE (lipoprotein component of BamABCDE complex)
MQYVRLFAVLGVAAVMGACTTAGNESISDATMENVQEKLTKGKTTQAEVRKRFGDPMKASFTDGGNETWEYEFTRLEAHATNFIPYVGLLHSGADGSQKSLVIQFDKRKIVQQFTMSNSKIVVDNGLLAR